MTAGQGFKYSSTNSPTGSLFTSGLKNDTVTQKNPSQIKGIGIHEAKALRNRGFIPVEVTGETSDTLRSIADRFGLKVIFYRADAANKSQKAGERADSTDGFSRDTGVLSGSHDSIQGAKGAADKISSVDGFVSTGQKNTIYLNADSTRHLLFIIGHETAHHSWLKQAGTIPQTAVRPTPVFTENQTVR